MAQKHVFVVLTNPVEGREDEYNDWYSNRHVKDVEAIPGVMSARRFELSEAQIRPETPYRYCALYEIETDDLDGVMKELKARAGTDAMPLTRAISKDRVAIVYKPMA